MRNPERNVMKAVRIDRMKLLRIVKENKQTHIEDFEQAVEDYKAAVLKIATENHRLAKTSNLDEIAKMQPTPHKPTSYEDSYTRAIRMLELSEDQTIEVEENVFNQLVLDEWSWKTSFTHTNAIYKTYQG